MATQTFSSGQVTVSGFTLSGFNTGSSADGTSNADYAGSVFTAEGVTTGLTTSYTPGTNVLWNSTGNIVGITGTGSWTLSVSLQHVNYGFGSAGNEELWIMGTTPVAADGDDVMDNGTDGTSSQPGQISSLGADSSGVTFNGTDATDLATLFHNLALNLPNWSVSDSFSVTFHFTASGNDATWTQYFTAPCFVTGTRIATPAGETAVEALQIGDLVMTASGQAKPIKWIGRRSYTAAVAAANLQARPVIVRKDAIAPGMPHRDLSVSANHALLVDDVFVQAASLVNGVTIVRNDDIAPVSYIHIEMDGHDVVFADGAPTETYVDDNSRLMFDNADEYYDMFGADQGTQTFCAERIEQGTQLEAIRRRIAARAGAAAPVASTGKLHGNVERLEDGVLHGWVMDTTSTTPVELEVLADGEVVGTTLANRYRVDLDFHGIAGGNAGFTFAMPASVTSLGQVTVRRAGDRKVVAQPKVAASV